MYAYVCSFPLILNIESHCSLKQQQTMAYYMRQVFGSNLFVDAVDVNARYLPSPELLRRKILIKVAFLCKLRYQCLHCWSIVLASLYDHITVQQTDMHVYKL